MGASTTCRARGGGVVDGNGQIKSALRTMMMGLSFGTWAGLWAGFAEPAERGLRASAVVSCVGDDALSVVGGLASWTMARM